MSVRIVAKKDLNQPHVYGRHPAKVLILTLLGLSLLGGVSSMVQAVPIEQVSLTQAATTSPAAPVDSNSTDTQGSTLWQLYQQVQQLQQEVRELRGQLEAQQDGLDRTQKELKNRYTDLDQRLELLKEQAQPAEENPTPDVPKTETPATPATSAPNSTPVPIQNAVIQNPHTVSNTPKSATIPKSLNTNKSGVTATKPATSPASTSNTVKPVGTNSVSSSSTNTSGNTSSNSSVLTQADAEKQAYINAYEAYKLGGATKAIQPMQQFIANYPASVYIPNAYYWLGEFYLANDPADFNKAKKSFNEVVTKYPKSAKASTALYRMATITQEIDKRPQDAIVMMKKLLKDYPSSAEAQYAKSYVSARS